MTSNVIFPFTSPVIIGLGNLLMEIYGCHNNNFIFKLPR